MDFSDIALLIVAGGKSSRMGQDKRFLSFRGVGLLERLCRKTSRISFAERFLCVEQVSPELQELADRFGLTLVTDEREGRGPMEGISRGLGRMKSSYGLAVSCDMPFLDFRVLRFLLAAAAKNPALRAVLPRTERWQPLAALYHRDMSETFAEALQRGDGKLGLVIAEKTHSCVDFPDNVMFFNVNTMADWRLACGRLANEERKVPLVTVSAPASNTGKTTFIEKLLPRLTERGIRVGVVKGDCHGYDVDEEGKDSWRFKKAGASGVAVVSPKGYFIEQRTERRANLVEMAGRLQDVDLVLIESRRHGAAPVVSLFRDKGELELTEDSTALFCKTPQELRGIQEYSLDDVDAAVRLVTFLMGN
ncbi:molybdopterin-guanine dinucleotide biosynthesis protein B [uncultured Mitsuokella sp.]|uniref:molybdopterin-guanine dinucleotide biosynthesis protein B n=1 Tax=uncultured Mitsuokella sp. TaxID=453120 RepID=UPI0025D0D610|nr:molybdopterin-guanine dinucleotide biosynthesis protein B [uncultured Mitsuokella sp.]